ncbi:type IV toxin-antitoxin system AbiEi family antitoxin domain-containing protein [Microtetraspora malaysiensis]|uniref:type IV toxin-antitoxin system AbiEi family antitoxin domain-containing protein n=1 Tax=Microtetraspora malaysiensis TaxID=161358 RepID=UPI003D8CD8E3
MIDPKHSVSARRLDRLGPTFTAAQAREGGIGSNALARLREAGLIWELSRGVYRKSDAPLTMHVDLLAACTRVPHGVLCLETALTVHDLTDEIPGEVNLAVPRGGPLPRITYPLVRVHRFAEGTFEEGIENWAAAPGELVRIYSASRTVVDCMRLRHIVGDQVALRALRSYLRRRGTSPSDLLGYAELLGGAGPLRNAIQVVLD